MLRQCTERQCILYDQSYTMLMLALTIICKWHTPPNCQTVDKSQLHVLKGSRHLQIQLG